MTRFDADLHRLATQLAAMVAAPAATAAADDATVVDLARRAVRTCCRHMLNDLAPQPEEIADPPSLADLALNPVEVLRAKLMADPPALTLPTANTEPQVAKSANEQWRRLGNAAEVVAHEWDTSDPRSRPSGENIWLRIADVAALVEVTATVDRHLIAAGPPSPAALRACVELAVAAEHTRRFAMSGPLPNPEPLRPAPRRLTPVVIRTVADLPTAVDTLGRFIATARHLRPDMIGALVTAHARTLDTLAAALTTNSSSAQLASRRRYADVLTAHGRALANVRVACRTLASIGADDPRPAMQMREVRSALRTLSGRLSGVGDVDVQTAVLAALRPALEFAPAVARAASAYIRSGSWLMSTDHDKLRWSRVNDEHPINEALELAVAHARALLTQLPASRPGREPYRAPHEILPVGPESDPYGRTRQNSAEVSSPAI